MSHLKLFLSFCLLLSPSLGAAALLKRSYLPPSRVEDRVLSLIEFNRFSPTPYSRSLSTLQGNFRRCLLKKGLKTANFMDCVGDNYEKVGESFDNTFFFMKTLLRKDFNSDLYKVCDGSNEFLCDSLNLSLSEALEGNETTHVVRKLQQKVKTVNVDKNILPIVNHAIDNLRKNLKDLNKCEKLMMEKKSETVRNLIDYVKGSSAKVPYMYDFNPFAMKKVEESEGKFVLSRRNRILAGMRRSV